MLEVRAGLARERLGIDLGEQPEPFEHRCDWFPFVDGCTVEPVGWRQVGGRGARLVVVQRPPARVAAEDPQRRRRRVSGRACDYAAAPRVGAGGTVTAALEFSRRLTFVLMYIAVMSVRCFTAPMRPSWIVVLVWHARGDRLMAAQSRRTGRPRYALMDEGDDALGTAGDRGSGKISLANSHSWGLNASAL
jgi:hypothetical protein